MQNWLSQWIILSAGMVDATSTPSYFLGPKYIGIIKQLWTYDDNISQKFQKPSCAILGAYNMFQK